MLSVTRTPLERVLASVLGIQLQSIGESLCLLRTRDRPAEHDDTPTVRFATVAREQHERSVAMLDRAVARFKKTQRLANRLELDDQNARKDALEWSARWTKH